MIGLRLGVGLVLTDGRLVEGEDLRREAAVREDEPDAEQEPDHRTRSSSPRSRAISCRRASSER